MATEKLKLVMFGLYSSPLVTAVSTTMVGLPTGRMKLKTVLLQSVVATVVLTVWVKTVSRCTTVSVVLM